MNIINTSYNSIFAHIEQFYQKISDKIIKPCIELLSKAPPIESDPSTKRMYNKIFKQVGRSNKKNPSQITASYIEILSKKLSPKRYEPLIKFAIQECSKNRNSCHHQEVVQVINTAYEYRVYKADFLLYLLLVNEHEFEPACDVVDTLNISFEEKMDLYLEVIETCAKIDKELAQRLNDRMPLDSNA